LDFYLSAAEVQSSFAQGNPGTATEDFNSLSVVQKPCGLFFLQQFLRGVSASYAKHGSILGEYTLP